MSTDNNMKHEIARSSDSLLSSTKERLNKKISSFEPYLATVRHVLATGETLDPVKTFTLSSQLQAMNKTGKNDTLFDVESVTGLLKTTKGTEMILEYIEGYIEGLKFVLTTTEDELLKRNHYDK